MPIRLAVLVGWDLGRRVGIDSSAGEVVSGAVGNFLRSLCGVPLPGGGSAASLSVRQGLVGLPADLPSCTGNLYVEEKKSLAAAADQPELHFFPLPMSAVGKQLAQ